MIGNPGGGTSHSTSLGFASTYNIWDTLLSGSYTRAFSNAENPLLGQNGATVYVVKSDQTVELRTVKVARAAGDNALLSEGVRPGETVVTDGQLRLLPGMKAESKNLADVLDAAKQPKKT